MRTWIHEFDIAYFVQWHGLLLDPQDTLCSHRRPKTLTQIRDRIDRVRAGLVSLELVDLIGAN